MIQVKKNKTYHFTRSVLYNLKSKNKLAHLLGFSLAELKILQSDEFYSCFQIEGSRNIQHPQEKLSAVHKYIGKLLSRIDVPEYLHSGRKKHSSITNAKSHLFSAQKTLTMDIEHFFPSTSTKKVFDFFRHIMKQSPDVAYLLTNILTYKDHIPTGSPVSMSLAFFSNISMFNELHSFARNRNCKMTVFVDDITFTGNAINPNFLSTVEKIVDKHGLKIKKIKTRVFHENSPKFITGVVVKNNQIEPEYKQLKKLREDELIYRRQPDTQINQLVYNGRLAYLSQININLKPKMDLKKLSS